MTSDDIPHQVLCLDLASVFSMSPYLMGSEAEPLTLQQWFGLVLAGIAMWVYNLKDEKNQDGEVVKGVNIDAGDIHVVRSVTMSRASFSSAQHNVRRSSARLDMDRSSGLRLSHGAGAVVRSSDAI